MSDSLYLKKLVLILSEPHLRLPEDLICLLILPYVLLREKVIVHHDMREQKSLLLPSFPSFEDWLRTEYIVTDKNGMNEHPWPVSLCSLVQQYTTSRIFKENSPTILTFSGSLRAILIPRREVRLWWGDRYVYIRYPETLGLSPVEVYLSKEGLNFILWITGEDHYDYHSIWKLRFSTLSSSANWELDTKTYWPLVKNNNHTSEQKWRQVDHDVRCHLFDHYAFYSYPVYVLDLSTQCYIAVIQNDLISDFLKNHFIYYHEETKRKYFIGHDTPFLSCVSSYH